jgi:hypothetical protein
MTRCIVGIFLPAAALLVAGCSTPREPEPARLANTSFELPLDSGWVQFVVNDSFPTDSGTIERSDTLGQPESGFAVRVYKYHREHAVVSQTVELETLAQTARFDARFRIGANVPCTPVAAVAFSYLDSAGARLGRTLFYLPSSYCTWTDSDSLHLIRITDTTGAWSHYSLDLQAELDSSLPLVDQSRIRRLCVELAASVDYSG